MVKPAISSQSQSSQSKTKDQHEPRSRFEAVPGRGLRLGERDGQLLADLYLHGVLSRRHLQALHFGSVPRCNARLRQLFDARFVTRRFLPSAPFGSEAVYALGPAGIPVVASRLTAEGMDADVAAIRRQCRQGLSPSLLEHTLAIAEFYIAVRLAVAQEPVFGNQSAPENQGILGDQPEHRIELERWLPELLCRHEYDIRRVGPVPGNGGSWQREIFKPDGFVRLRRCASEQGVTDDCRSYFLEIDRGHVSSEKFLGKLRSHRRYLDSGLFAEVYGDGVFRTLVVTTSRKRLDNLRSLIEGAGEDLFWFTTFEAISSEGVLASIWQVPEQDEQATLIGSNSHRIRYFFT